MVDVHQHGNHLVITPAAELQVMLMGLALSIHTTAVAHRMEEETGHLLGRQEPRPPPTA